MCRNIFDTHAHYTDSAFDDDRAELLAALPAAGISCVLTCAVDIDDARAAIELAGKYPYIYAACGVHPHEAQNAPADRLSQIFSLCSDEKAVAVGEIGLDYHYDFSPRERQLEVFREQLSLAKELNLPVIIHDREAHEDTLRLIKEFKPRGVVHCYSGSAETARELLKYELYFGFGGAVTFKNAVKPLEASAAVPLDRLLIETDCPYMTPVPHRGKRCDSTYIPYTAAVLSRIKERSPQEICDITAENAKRCFGI